MEDPLPATMDEGFQGKRDKYFLHVFIGNSLI
jgi:hypothetical protein